ncbi:hypothetical protein DMR24_17890 [Klebsiella variicola]|nr:hypothetical protein DMR24_17890 [Klebsiella variicola]
MCKLTTRVIYMPINKPIIIPNVVIVVIRIIFITQKLKNIFSYVPFDAEFFADDILRAVSSPSIIDIFKRIIIIFKNIIDHPDDIFEADIFTLPLAVRANLFVITSLSYMMHDIFIINAFMTNILIFPHFYPLMII